MLTIDTMYILPPVGDARYHYRYKTYEYRKPNEEVIKMKETKDTIQYELNKSIFKLALDNTGIGILSLNLEGEILYANHECLNIWGHRIQSLVGMNINRLFFSPSKNGFKELIKSLENNNKDGKVVFEKTFTHKSSERILCEISSLLLREPNNEPIQFIWYVKEITKQNERKENLKKQLDYERNIVEFTNALMQKGPNVINDSLKFLLQASKSSRVYIFENFLDEENRLAMKQTHEVCAFGVVSEIDNPMLQHIVYERDGFKWWAEELFNDKIINGIVSNFQEGILKKMLQMQGIKSVLIIPLWLDQKLFGFIGFDDTYAEKEFDQYDIDLLRSASEIISLNIQNITNKTLLIKNNQKLKKANATKDRFISILAHDLKNPFISILGFSKLLTKNIEKYDKAKIKEFAVLINNSSKQTYNLLNNLLEWSRSQLNEISYNPQQSNLLDIIQEIYALTNSIAESKNIKITLKVPKELSIEIDREMIKTVFRNLLNNSIKFTENGGSITISAKRDRDKAQIQITDTGIGMSETVSKSLFIIGKTVSNLGTAGEKGTGFGLLLCKEFIDKHNGTISVESEEGKGTRIVITLPI